MTELSILDHAYSVLLVGLLAIVVLISQPAVRGKSFSTGDKIAFYWSNSIVLYSIALAALLVWFLQGRSGAVLGFAWPAADTTTRGLFWVGIFLLWLVAESFRNVWPRHRLLASSRRCHELTPFMPANRNEVWHSLQLSLCAGVTEEIVFRGFLIQYFVRLITGQALNEMAEPLQNPAVWIAIVIPGVIFGLAHRYSGWAAVLKIVWLAVVFGIIYVVTGSLLYVIVLHVFVDVVASLMSPWIFRQTAVEFAPGSTGIPADSPETAIDTDPV